MNNNATLEKMSLMKLHGMKQAFELSMSTNGAGKIRADELIGILIEAEYDDRQNRKLERLLKAAKFRYKATIEELNFSHSRNLNKNEIFRLATCGFIRKKESIILTGPTGVGKSYIASALGHQACFDGYKVMYFNLQKLFTRLKMLKADASEIREKLKIEKQDLLILDDFGLQVLDVENRLSLLEIIEDRHGKKSTIITSQLPTTKWHEAIGDGTIADAILDRIVHTAHRIELQGESLRKK